jgi:hypothetical protein
MDILSENSKKRIPKVSYRALKARKKKICARSVTSLTKFLNLFKKKKKYMYKILIVDS